jgi:putative ribosome biogenesis GTPase RsgA
MTYRFPRTFHSSCYVTDITNIVHGKQRIMVVGPFGAGKSSLIRTMEMSIRDNNNPECDANDNGVDGTLIAEEFMTQFSFSVIDTRGLFKFQEKEFNDLYGLLTANLPIGAVMPMNGTTTYNKHSKEKDLSIRPHAVIFVVAANDKRLLNNAYDLADLKKYCRENGIKPVTVVTKTDRVDGLTLQTATSIAMGISGSSKDATFSVKCYESAYEKRNIRTDISVLQILSAALKESERFVKIQKLRDVSSAVTSQN